jgi:hypothetical protein
MKKRRILMMKKSKKGLFKTGLIMTATVILTLGMQMVVFARDWDAYEAAVNAQETSSLLPSDVTSSTGTANAARSTALAMARSEITNEGYGVIGVYAETTMHKSVDWAYLTIMLERYSETSGTWVTMKRFEKEFYPEDQTDGVLVAAKLQEFVDDQEPGYYYRVRAIHELEFDDGWYEVKTTRTNGIMITNAP